MYTLETTNVDSALRELSRDLQEVGTRQGSRNGETMELSPVAISLARPLQREILNPARRANLAAQIAETMWVLAGRDDVDFLAHYIPRARDFSDDGKVWRAAYGHRLRRWPMRDGSGDAKDQIAWAAEHLSEHPDSRRVVMAIWDPVRDQPEGNGVKDIPCNNWLQFLLRDGQLDLHVALRSNDLIWGWSGINQFEWSVLLEVVAWLVGAEVGRLHFSTTSLHIYRRHYVRTSAIENAPYDDVANMDYSTRFAPACNSMYSNKIEQLDSLIDEWFAAEELIRSGKVVDIATFPEPMLREWLAIIDCYWNGRGDDDPRYPVSARMLSAWRVSHKRAVERDPFAVYVDRLHRKKDAAYGDSWCRRGEMLGIMANIARKIDRLGKTDDLETAADTAIDLLVYLLKYRGWLDARGWPGVTRSTDYVSRRLDDLARTEQDAVNFSPRPDLEQELRESFDQNLIPAVKAQHGTQRHHHADAMARRAYVLARSLWNEEQGTDEYQGADHD